MNMLPLYELLLNDEDDEIFAISAVSEPAIMSDWVYFNKNTQHLSTVNKEKRLIVGSVLIPDRKILRLDGEGKKYEVYISADTVKKASHLYLQKKYQDNVTLEHEKPVKDISMVESWIVEDEEQDKSRLYGLDAPVNSWVAIFKVNNDEVWNDYVKTGKVKGWSIEGLFSQEYRGVSNTEELLSKPIDELTDEEADVIMYHIKEMMENPSVTSTYPGEKAENDEYISEALLSDLKELIEWFKENVKNK